MSHDSFETYIPKIMDVDETMSNSIAFMKSMKCRRSIRNFSTKKVPLEVIDNIVQAASAAPSGANKQPWTFCIVGDPSLKQKIKEAAEKEEYLNYNGRMSDEWKDDLKSFGTDWQKPFLTKAPFLIAVFKQTFENRSGIKRKNYYVTESVGIAVGFLLAAIENAGLVALTHTPSPMNFLHKLLNRPENEKPFLLIPVGYPAENCTVPTIKKKEIAEVIQYFL